jgi:biotin transport system substrate-specific component
MFLACAFVFEYMAVGAYFLYLFQGALGAPFFSRFGSGILHLLGPTGGYLFGFAIAMLCTVIFKKLSYRSNFSLLLEYWFCCILYYAPGLLQLALFVPSGKVLILGLYPFFIGDFIVKAVLFLILIKRAYSYPSTSSGRAP